MFRASVLDVKNFGLVVELPDVLLTGLDPHLVADGRLLRLQRRRSGN